MQPEIISIKSSQVIREFEDTEYEVKFGLANTDHSPLEHLFHAEALLAANERYLIDPIRTQTTMKTHFFTDQKGEYSIFRYEGSVMLKIKKHDTLNINGFGVFKNSEHFLYDQESILKKLGDPDVMYAGSMVKKRAKDFIIDKKDGRAYSLAVTVCTVGSHKQHQMEIEYYGYIPSLSAINENCEEEILQRLTELCDYFRSHDPSYFYPSVERKYDFVSSHLSPEEIRSTGKNAILLNLQSL